MSYFLDRRSPSKKEVTIEERGISPLSLSYIYTYIYACIFLFFLFVLFGLMLEKNLPFVAFYCDVQNLYCFFKFLSGSICYLNELVYRYVQIGSTQNQYFSESDIFY
jgi:hypothetical protein